MIRAAEAPPMAEATQDGSDVIPANIGIDETFRPRGATRPHDPNYAIRVVRGDGSYLWDDHGNRYLDFVSGYSSTSFGHAHPRLVAVASEQLRQLTQIVGLNHPSRAKLERELSVRFEEAFGGDAKCWLTTSGARAVELAWKIAYQHRPGKILAFDFGYHGRSIATSMLSDTKQLPILEGPVARTLQYPVCTNCPVGKKPESCRAECADDDLRWIEANAESISSIIVEPALGARGYYYAPDVFFQRFQEVARRGGILLIDDEIQMGFGRLGTFFAARRQDWSPDLLVLGKSLGGGIVPIAAVVGNSSLLDEMASGLESETFAGNPLACSIALESIAILEEILQVSLPAVALVLATAVDALRRDFPIIKHADVRGMSAYLEFEPLVAEKVAHRLVEHHLLLHWSGIYRDRLVIIPPLTATGDEIASGLGSLRETLELFKC